MVIFEKSWRTPERNGNGVQACESLFAVLCCVWLPCIKMARTTDELDVSEVRVHRMTALNGMVMQMENRDSMALLAAIFTGQVKVETLSVCAAHWYSQIRLMVPRFCPAKI